MDDPIDLSAHIAANPIDLSGLDAEAFYADMVRRGLAIKLPTPVAMDSPEAKAAADLLDRKN